MTWIDVHTHLNMLEISPDEALSLLLRAARAGHPVGVASWVGAGGTSSA